MVSAMTERQRQQYDGDEGLQPMGAVLDMRTGDERPYQCERHGEYRGAPFTLTGRTWIKPACPACEQERKDREAEEEARARAEDAERRVVAAGVPERFHSATIDGFMVTGAAAETKAKNRALATVRRYLERFDERRRVGGSLILAGTTGTGKTHLACAVVGALIRSGWRARYTDVMGMMQAVKASYRRGADETEEQAIDRFTAPDLLVVDEVGVQYGTDSERAVVHHVLDRRYLEVRPTIVCGNLDLEGLREYLGERAVSRLHESGGLLVPFDWSDHRMRR